MQIMSMRVRGAAGEVEISKTTNGAMVVKDHEILCEFDRDDSREVRFAKSLKAARAVFGSSRTREAHATNSELSAFCDHIDTVGGF